MEYRRESNEKAKEIMRRKREEETAIIVVNEAEAMSL